MKKFLLSFTLLLTLSPCLYSQVTTYSIGGVVDDFTVTDVHGVEHNLYTITASGKHVYIDFFFDTCGPCQGASPHFGDFYDKYGCNAGDVYCLVINNGTDSDAEVIAYEEEFGGSGNHAPAVSADGGSGAVDAAFGIGAYPTFCMIGSDNKLMQSDIWPVSSVAHLEATFTDDFNPSPMACSGTVSITENNLSDLNIYPNPTTNSTTLSFSSQSEEEALISIYNLLGETITTTNVQTKTGQNTIELNVENYQSGSYIVQIQLGDAIITKKLEIIK